MFQGDVYHELHRYLVQEKIATEGSVIRMDMLKVRGLEIAHESNTERQVHCAAGPCAKMETSSAARFLGKASNEIPIGHCIVGARVEAERRRCRGVSSQCVTMWLNRRVSLSLPLLTVVCRETKQSEATIEQQ